MQPNLQELNIQRGNLYDHGILPANLEVPRRMYPFFAIWLVRTGEGVVHSNNQTLHLSPGDMVCLPAFEERSHRFSPGSHLLSLHLSLRWRGSDLCPWLKFRQNLNHCREVLEKAISQLCPQPEDPSRKSPTQVWEDLAAWYHFLAIWFQHGVSYLPLPPKINDHRVDEISRALKNQPQFWRNPQKILPSLTPLSRVQVDRLFQRQVGMSLKQWCERQTLIQALEKLPHANIPIKSIALEMGFRDSAHFAKWFRQHQGLSPGQFRKNPHKPA